MNGKDLLNGLGFIDDELVQEAEQKKIKKASIKFFIPIAASLAVVVFSILMNHQTTPPMLPNDNIPPITSEKHKEYALRFNINGSYTADRIVIEGHFWEELTSMQMKKLLPNIAEKYQLEGTVDYSSKDGKTSIFGVNTKFKVDNKEVKISIAPDEIMKCYIIDGKPIISEIEGVKIEASIFKTDKNSMGERNYIYYADFKIDDVAYYVEYSGDKNDKEFFTNIVADIILGGKADLSVLENPIVPELRNDKLAENVAYTEADFGAYLPKIPKGYIFNGATRFINQARNYLSASWSQGYNDINITISKIEDQDFERIVSIGDTKLYDISLYPIPWADSMPKDTREIIENPIFKIEDLTLDVVKMREHIRSEQNNPSGNSVNMNFSVLYDDILVNVTTESVSSEYLFDALSALPRN